MEEEKKLQVVIVDDYALIRQELRSMLECDPEIQVVGEARNGLEAIFLVEKFRPRIVLMDINMPRMNGIEATAQIRRGYPETIVIGLSVNADTQHHATMKHAGAVALIPKDEVSDRLYDTIHDALKSQ
jgi:DNA-binding NarL/FixJ family response regulator